MGCRFEKENPLQMILNEQKGVSLYLQNIQTHILNAPVLPNLQTALEPEAPRGNPDEKQQKTQDEPEKPRASKPASAVYNSDMEGWSQPIGWRRFVWWNKCGRNSSINLTVLLKNCGI